MTTKSHFSPLSFKPAEDGGVYVTITADSRRVSVRLGGEYLASELQDANIPGLTVTYEKPVELPTEPGIYQDKDGAVWQIEKRPGASLYRIGAFWPQAPADVAPFVRLIPVTEADQ
jgi:hypothetical protein